MKRNCILWILVVILVMTLCTEVIAARPEVGGQRVTLADLVLAARCMTGQVSLSPEEMQAIDPNADGRITLSDLVTLARTYAAQAHEPVEIAPPLATATPDASAVATTAPDGPALSPAPDTAAPGEAGTEVPSNMDVAIGDKVFTATLADTQAARELAEMMKNEPLSIELHEYGGFEMVGSLGQSLTPDDRRVVTVPGDIMLYNGNSVVLFYGTNTWSYTPLAKVDDLTGWSNALQGDTSTVVLSLKQG